MAQKFEWDENKNQANIRKHGVSFQEATLIFDKPTFDEVDDREDYGEIRVASIGESRGEVFYVVYTWRDDVIRIISARKGNRDERRKYSELYKGRN